MWHLVRGLSSQTTRLPPFHTCMKEVYDGWPLSDMEVHNDMQDMRAVLMAMEVDDVAILVNACDKVVRTIRISCRCRKISSSKNRTRKAARAT